MASNFNREDEDRLKINIDSDDALICPDCGESYLHQELVEIIFRDREDGDATSVEMSKDLLTMRRLKNEQIKQTRRHITSIYFSCENENCLETENVESLKLNIYQHKGQTYMEWERNRWKSA